MSDSDPEMEDPPDSMEEVLEEALAEEKGSGAPEPVPSVDEVDIRDALRAALRDPEEPVSITKEVQRKIREDTKGEFFADGWSTASSPKETFLVTSIVMLIVVVLVYLLISPYGM